MKLYQVRISPRARADLKNRVAYLVNVKKNPQATASVMEDFHKTRESLKSIAGSIKEPDSEILKSRRLKRINFRVHDYFLLYRIDGDKVIIMNVFHASENFETKLD